MNALTLDYLIGLWRRSSSPGHLRFADKLERHRVDKFGPAVSPAEARRAKR